MKTVASKYRGERIRRQRRVARWRAATFGAAHANALPACGLHLAESVIEAAQAAGCDADAVRDVVDRVFRAPKGELPQVIGGVGVSLLALAELARVCAETAEEFEFARLQSQHDALNGGRR